MHDGIIRRGLGAKFQTSATRGKEAVCGERVERTVGVVGGSVSRWARLFYTDIPISFFKFTGREKFETQIITRLIFSS